MNSTNFIAQPFPEQHKHFAHYWEFRALGVDWILHTNHAIPLKIRERIAAHSREINDALSRFQSNSLVRTFAKQPSKPLCFPEWVQPLFDCADILFQITHGAIDPCVGNTEERYGYRHDYLPWQQQATTRQTEQNIYNLQQGTERQPPTGTAEISWGDIIRNNTTLAVPTITRAHTNTQNNTTRNQQDRNHHNECWLDFGAFAKGYFIDYCAELLREEGYTTFLIDASGDFWVEHCEENPIRIALENPYRTEYAVGTIDITHGAFCSSATTRRQWTIRLPKQDHANHNETGRIQRIHHIFDARRAQPTRSIDASWAMGSSAMLIDGIATALFTTPISYLYQNIAFEGATIQHYNNDVVTGSCEVNNNSATIQYTLRSTDNFSAQWLV